MTHDELLELIQTIQSLQSETGDLEVKAAQRGTPQRLFESLSAFANRTGGGVILLGLDENRAFKVVGVGDAQRIMAEVSHLAAENMEPLLRPEFTLANVEGRPVLAVEVFEIPVEQKPCFYKPAGLQSGAYVRVGNTNRQMSGYEVFNCLTARTQPTFDEETVAGATLADLDRERLEEYLRQLRRARLDAPYLNRPFEEVLKQLGIVRDIDGILRPTLAGLLMFGVYPQTFEPQLVITFLHYYGTDEAEKTPRGERFLDNRKFEGPIPDMVEAAVNYVMASIRKSSLIEGLLRRDIPEYPDEAVREAVVNAVAHRDYSPYVRGSYVQIRLLADRLEVQSPGGLFGNVTEETLEEEQSTRNRMLMRLMEDAHLVENRGSGIRAMIEAMRRLNLEPPRFQDRRSSFLVTFRGHTLMGPETVAWLNRFAGRPLNDRQRIALAFLRYNAQLTNSDYQRLNRIDSVTATRELRGLVQADLIEQHSTRRWAYYTLSQAAKAESEIASSSGDEARVLAYVRSHGSINNNECRELLHTDTRRANYILKKMLVQGVLVQQGKRRWTRYVLAS